jgi:hypothetical protein
MVGSPNTSFFWDGIYTIFDICLFHARINLVQMLTNNRSLESRLLIHHQDQIYGTPLTHTHQATDNVNERRYTSKSDRNRSKQSHAKTRKSSRSRISSQKQCRGYSRRVCSKRDTASNVVIWKYCSQLNSSMERRLEKKKGHLWEF